VRLVGIVVHQIQEWVELVELGQVQQFQVVQPLERVKKVAVHIILQAVAVEVMAAAV
jgi:hypothetical protein